MSLSREAKAMQENDMERVIKCRIRSETEARKAAEAKMKRALKEAFELKKELSILCKEKKEWKIEMEDLKKQNNSTSEQRLNQYKMEIKSLKTELQEKVDSEKEWKTEIEDHLRELKEDLKEKTNDCNTATENYKRLEIKFHKFKVSADEQKRKYQKSLTEARENLLHAKDEYSKISEQYQNISSKVDKQSKNKAALKKAKEKIDKVMLEHSQELLRVHNESKKQTEDLTIKLDNLEVEKVDMASIIVSLEKKIEELTTLDYEGKNDQQTDLDDLIEKERKTNEESLKKISVLEQTILDLKSAQSDNQMLERAVEEQKQISGNAVSEAKFYLEKNLKSENEVSKLQEHIRQIERALVCRGITISFLLKTNTKDNNNQKEDKKPTTPIKKEKCYNGPSVSKKRYDKVKLSDPHVDIDDDVAERDNAEFSHKSSLPRSTKRSVSSNQKNVTSRRK